MKIKISVIIPIYNMVQWIGHAIETVEKQTISDDLELICVDDGSTDKSLEVLKKYEAIYSNLIVLHQENNGAGAARNFGIDQARGEYVAFLDADDYYYCEDALEILYLKAVEHRAMICRGSSCDDRDGTLSYQGLRSERSFSEEGFISKHDFPGPTGFWAGIYNRDFLIRNELRFQNLRRGQDSLFFAETIARAGEIYCLSKIVYVYRKEHKTVIYTEKRAEDAIKTFYQILYTAHENSMVRIFQAWKKELFGEPAAMIYKYAASGNKEIRNMIPKLNALIGGGLHEGVEIEAFVEKVKSDKEPFLNHLKKLDAVYVFGAGTVGKKVVDYLIKNEINPTAVIVSDLSQNPASVEDIPVKPITAIQTEQNYDVIVATFQYLHEKILRMLKKYGIEKVTTLDLCAFYLWQDEIIH